MSEHVWCHGPSCHLNHTLDRVRGSKGSKVLRTRKVQFNPEYINMYSYFCSNGCYNDFANKYIQQVIAIAPRTEPLETPIEKSPQKELNDKGINGYTYYRNKDNRKKCG
jgi:hypothetical protein